MSVQYLAPRFNFTACATARPAPFIARFANLRSPELRLPHLRPPHLPSPHLRFTASGNGPRFGIAGLLLVISMTLIAGSAIAVNRCDANGRITYTDGACEGGSASSLGAVTAPDAEIQRRAALEADQRRLMADRMTRERERQLAAERSAQQREQVGRQAHEKKCKLLDMKTRWAREDASRANVKGEARARRSAQRKAEQYELECR